MQNTNRGTRRSKSLRAEHRKSAKLVQQQRRQQREDRAGKKRLKDSAPTRNFDHDGFEPNVRERRSVAHFLDLTDL